VTTTTTTTTTTFSPFYSRESSAVLHRLSRQKAVMKQVLIISPTSCEIFTAFGSLLSLLLGLEVTTTMHGSFLSGSLFFQSLMVSLLFPDYFQMEPRKLASRGMYLGFLEAFRSHCSCHAINRLQFDVCCILFATPCSGM
jgi:hypothetical protein